MTETFTAEWKPSSEEIRNARRTEPMDDCWIECLRCGITFHTLYSISRDDHLAGRCSQKKEPFRRK